MTDNFKVGDRVKGIEADIVGCEGIITEITDNGHKYIQITKAGAYMDKGYCTRSTCWENCLELIEPITSWREKYGCTK